MHKGSSSVNMNDLLSAGVTSPVTVSVRVITITFSVCGQCLMVPAGSSSLKVTLQPCCCLVTTDFRTGIPASLTHILLHSPSGLRVTFSSIAMRSSHRASVSYTHLRAHETDSYLVC